MEEVRQAFGERISEIAEEFVEIIKKKDIGRGIYIIADEIFSDGMTIVHIAMLLLFAEKVIELFPSKRKRIYEDVFKSLILNTKFKKKK